MSKRRSIWLLTIGLCMAGACAGSPSPKPEHAPPPPPAVEPPANEPPAGEPPASEAPTSEAPAPVGPGPFARCQAGRCTFDFTIDLAPGGRDALVVLDRCVDPVPNCPTNVGRLTPAGRAAAVAVRDALSKEHVAESYGCPGCADGPVYVLALPAPNGAATQHRYDPQHDSHVPELLRPAQALLRSSERAAALCTANENVELTAPCSPLR